MSIASGTGLRVLARRSVARGVTRRVADGPLTLFRAAFSATLAAPLPASLPVDVGGPLTVVDTGNAFAQSGGALVVNGTAVANDGLMTTQHTRTIGIAFLWKTRARTTVQTASNQGLSRTALGSSSVLAGGIYTTPTTFQVRDGATIIETLTLSAGEHQFLGVALSMGAMLFMRDGTSGPWTLLWVTDNDISTPVFGKWRMNFLNQFTTDDWTILDLAQIDSRFVADSGLTTTRLLAPAIGATAQSRADALIEFSGVVPPTGSVQLDYRSQNATNGWSAQVEAAGSFVLVQRTAGVNTARITAAHGVAIGAPFRAVIAVAGNVHKAYVGTTLLGSYTDATNQGLTETRLLVVAGSITDLLSRPRFITLDGRIA